MKQNSEDGEINDGLFSYFYKWDNNEIREFALFIRLELCTE